MKRTILFIIIIASLYSCDEKGEFDNIIVTKEYSDVVPTFLSVDKKTLEFEAEGGQQELKISSNTDWTITWPALWCGVSSTAGTGDGTITITVSENTSSTERTGDIVISNAKNSASVTVKITQKASKFPGSGDNPPPTTG